MEQRKIGVKAPVVDHFSEKHEKQGFSEKWSTTDTWSTTGAFTLITHYHLQNRLSYMPRIYFNIEKLKISEESKSDIGMWFKIFLKREAFFDAPVKTAGENLKKKKELLEVSWDTKNHDRILGFRSIKGVQNRI